MALYLLSYPSFNGSKDALDKMARIGWKPEEGYFSSNLVNPNCDVWKHETETAEVKKELFKDTTVALFVLNGYHKQKRADGDPILNFIKDVDYTFFNMNDDAFFFETSYLESLYLPGYYDDE